MSSITTFVRRLGDILLLSLRPVQLMLAVSAFIVAAFIMFNGSAATSFFAINAYNVAAMFIVYACLSVYCSTSVDRSEYTPFIQYTTAIAGLILWTVSFILEVLVDSTPLVGLHIVPVVAECWVLAQLMSDVKSQDRRVL